MAGTGTLTVTPDTGAGTVNINTLPPSGQATPANSLPATLRGIRALFTEFPYWDISWCVAIVYMVGSLVWVANGFTGLLPLVGNYSSEGLKLANTWTAFAGASIFFMGSYLLFLEAINANRSGCFGWAVEQVVEVKNQVDVEDDIPTARPLVSAAEFTSTAKPQE